MPIQSTFQLVISIATMSAIFNSTLHRGKHRKRLHGRADGEGKEETPVTELERRRVRFAPYKGRMILHINFSNCSSQEIYDIMRRVTDCLATQPAGSVLALTDFAGVSVGRPILDMMRELAVLHKPFIKKSALIGTLSLPAEFKDGVGIYSRREFGIFATREEALRWLVS